MQTVMGFLRGDLVVAVNPKVERVKRCKSVRKRSVSS